MVCDGMYCLCKWLAGMAMLLGAYGCCSNRTLLGSGTFTRLVVDWLAVSNIDFSFSIDWRMLRCSSNSHLIVFAADCSEEPAFVPKPLPYLPSQRPPQHKTWPLALCIVVILPIREC